MIQHGSWTRRDPVWNLNGILPTSQILLIRLLWSELTIQLVPISIKTAEVLGRSNRALVDQSLPREQLIFLRATPTILWLERAL